MYAANVEGTENVLRAALEASTPKVVYVSTVAAFGNTKGEVVDETYEHTGEELHLLLRGDQGPRAPGGAAADRRQGLPCVIVQPGGVYGPDDHSAIGDLIERFAKGKLPAIVFPDLGFNLVHRDDVVAGDPARPRQGRDRASSTCSAARSPPCAG